MGCTLEEPLLLFANYIFLGLAFLSLSLCPAALLQVDTWGGETAGGCCKTLYCTLILIILHCTVILMMLHCTVILIMLQCTVKLIILHYTAILT